jgi:hypothetical protein
LSCHGSKSIQPLNETVTTRNPLEKWLKISGFSQSAEEIAQRFVEFRHFHFLSCDLIVPAEVPRMDKVTRWPRCALRADGREELKCIRCDPADPMKTDLAKWADSPLAKSASNP